MTGVIFFFLSLAPTNPTSAQQRGRRLPTHRGMWSKPEISTSLRQTEARIIAESYMIYTGVPSSCGVCFPETRGHERREKQLKLPTFSGQRARRSEQHGPDKHQTSGRLHLLRPGVSSPYPRGGGDSHCLQDGTVLLGLPVVGVWLLSALALLVYFPISVTSSMEFRAFSAVTRGARRG